MSRIFRLLEKKRGDRRTVTKWVGGLGEALFFGALFLLGCTALAYIVPAPWVKPEHYSVALGQGYWLTVLTITAIVAVGASGIVWAVLQLGTSAERRSSLASRAGELQFDESLGGTAATTPVYPTIPHDDGLTNSPGIELAYRLPPANSPGWRLASATTFAVLWNALSLLLLVWAGHGLIVGQPQWFLTAVSVGFLGVGVWSLVYLLKQLWVHAALGPTMLEIDAHPLRPGHSYRLLLSQAGHLRIRCLELWLICEEEATFCQGTDIRVETARVYEQRLLRQEDFLIETAKPHVDRCPVSIPAEAMHSFQATFHGVHWRLVVRGAAEGWPDFERAYPIIVNPGAETSSAWQPPLAQPAVNTPHVPLPRVGAGVSA